MWPQRGVWGAWLHDGEHPLVGVTGRGRGFKKWSADWWLRLEEGVASRKGPRSGRGLRWGRGDTTGERSLVDVTEGAWLPLPQRGTANGEAVCEVGVAKCVGVATRRRTLIGVAKGAWLYECVANRGRGYMKGSADWWRCYEGGVAPGKGVANGGGPRSGRGRTWGAGLHGGER